MRIIKISESKKDKMSEYAEKMLKFGGKLMQCLEELDEDDYGERDDEDWDEDEDMYEREDMGQRRRMRRESGSGGGMGQRRSRRTGRFIR